MSQLRLLQRLGRTGIHAVDPALDLLNGQSVMAAGFTDLDLEPSSRTEALNPPSFFSLARPRAAWSSQYVSQVLTRMGSVMVDIRRSGSRSTPRFRRSAPGPRDERILTDFLDTTDPSPVDSANCGLPLAAANTGHRLPGCPIGKRPSEPPSRKTPDNRALSSLALPLECRRRAERSRREVNAMDDVLYVAAAARSAHGRGAERRRGVFGACVDGGVSSGHKTASPAGGHSVYQTDVLNATAAGSELRVTSSSWRSSSTRP